MNFEDSMIDFRSDTVTQPSPEMREAIFNAQVGDDVFGDDPTINILEEMAADRLGKEQALFVASGTMGNLVSILSHSNRGDEIIVGDKSHIFKYEAGGASALGGVAYHTVKNHEDGKIDPDDVLNAIRDASDNHNPKTSMIALENTQNMCGGRVLDQFETKIFSDIAKNNNLKFHIDGARIFNASVKLGIDVKKIVEGADSVSFCLSKGLACPVGSVVCGDDKFIESARKWRKMLGGGMRQAGFLASAGIVALDNMVNRLAEDHENAQKLAFGLSQLPHINIDVNSVETNLVFFEIDFEYRSLVENALNQNEIKGASKRERWRFATHYGIESSDIDITLDVMGSILHG